MRAPKPVRCLATRTPFAHAGHRRRLQAGHTGLAWSQRHRPLRSRRRWSDARGWRWGGGAGAALVFALVFLQSGETPAPDLPPELRDEPDVFIDGALITQFRDDGGIEYRIAARELRQYERDGVTTLDRPALELHSPGAPPWRVSARRGVLSTVPGPSGTPEEQLVLRESVVLERDLGAGGALVVSTVALHVYPERQYARTDRPVMIEAPGRRSTAAGFEGDLERGWLELSSAPGQRVHIVAVPRRDGGGP